ncbi:hypothetical protein K525DRAFT_274875 [Schizophyllum commune Loenen D]|nr:hypothetical protein K525DRAFT_274875 [Schizophyllum commune Loenen D]
MYAECPTAADAKAEKARAKAAAKAPRQVEDNPTIVTWLLVTPKPEIRITNKKTGATKATKKPPIKLGPTTLSTSTTFDDFKVQIAAVARAPCDHLKLHTFKGYIEKKARKIEHEAPLMDGSQLAHMLTKAKNIEPKDRAIVELVICMDAPEKPKKPELLPWEAGAAVSSDGEEPVSDLRLLLGRAPGALDAALGPLMKKICERYPVGRCKDHPEDHCAVWKDNGQDWHFILDETKQRVWAGFMSRMEATVDTIPIASRHFKIQHAANYGRRGAPLPAAPSTPAAPGIMYGAPPPMAWYTPPPPAHYGPPAGMPPYGAAQWPAQPPLAPPQPPAPPAIRPLPMDLYTFCERYDLLDNVYDVLAAAHFRVGDAIDDSMSIKDYGLDLSVFEWNRFKEAYHTYSREPRAADTQY